MNTSGQLQDQDKGDSEIMSARRGKQDVKAGLEQMEGMVDSLIEKHLSKYCTALNFRVFIFLANTCACSYLYCSFC